MGKPMACLVMAFRRAMVKKLEKMGLLRLCRPSCLHIIFVQNIKEICKISLMQPTVYPFIIKP